MEFFDSDSESSFRSNGMGDSRMAEFQEDLINDTHFIFENLQLNLQPSEEYNDEDKIDYLINRAGILSDNVIPKHLEHSQIQNADTRK